MSKAYRTLVDFPEIKFYDGFSCCKFLVLHDVVKCHVNYDLFMHTMGERKQLISAVLNAGGTIVTPDKVVLMLEADSHKSCNVADEIIADHAESIALVLTRTVAIPLNGADECVFSVHYNADNPLMCTESINFQNVRDMDTFRELIDPVIIHKRFFSAKWSRCIPYLWND
jgi:hypothetical protein